MDRAKVHVTDVVIAVAVFIATIRIAPILYDLMDPVQANADPFSLALMQLVIPSIFIAIILSIGISAVREN